VNATPYPRAHLVERAVEAMAGQSVAPAPPPPAPPSAPQPGPAAAPRPDARPDVRPEPRPELRPEARAEPAAPITVAMLGKAGLVVAPCGTQRSRLSEEIAVVQHSVLRTIKATRATDGRCPRMVMVTSARPGEGKTFTALNLAASLANSGTKPVVLVDVDGKRGSVSELLGQAGTPGLRALAAEPGRPALPLLVPTAIKRLSLLTAGPAQENAPGVPPGQLMAAALLRLAAALPEHLIILDTPPCLSTSDPGALAPIVGQVLVVVEAERTQRSEVEAALDMVDSCPTLQLVLNRAVLTANDTFGAYGGYGAYGAYPGQ
jgi:protein-tyrosine kinase